MSAATSSLPAPERFARFHAANPQVYDELRRLALQAKREGAERIGIRMLWEVMRWNQRLYLETRDAHSERRLNDHYCPFYARLLMEREPALVGMFETRRAAGELPDELRVVQAQAALSPTGPPPPQPADTDGAPGSPPAPRCAIFDPDDLP